MPENMTQEEILMTLQSWFKQRKGKEIAPGTNYLDSGYIDSFEIIEFIAFVEGLFGIRFSAEEFQSPKFTKLEDLSTMISGKMCNESL